MRGLSSVTLAAAALGFSASLSMAAGHEPRLLDHRLTEPEAFGRYTDTSRPHPDAVLAPGWAPEASRPAQGNPLALTPSAPARFPNPLIVPLAALRAEPALEPSEPKGARLGLIALGVAAVGLGLVLLGTRNPRPARKTRIPKGIGAAPQEELAPILRWEPPAPTKPAYVYVGWRYTPPADEPVAATEPILTESWRAISAREQHAIDRWDHSLDKQLGLASLEEWLDRHASDLPNVDIAHLKDKLRRDA